MSREQRYDIGTLRPKHKLPDGRLRVDGLITRSGVFEYLLPNGQIQREWRPPGEVFKPESLETLKGAVLTDDHPGSGMVSSKTARQLQRGIVGDNVRKDGTHVAATIYVTDEDLIQKMESGKRDLSAGYTCDIERKDGITPDGERYNVIQRNIVYNHTAVVESGRAGSARVRMDAAQQLINEERVMANDKDRDNALLSAASKIAALEGQLATETARADAAEGRIDSLEKEVEKLRLPDPNADKLAELTVEVETHKKRADVAERGLASLHERVKEGVKRRVDLERSASEVYGSDGQKNRFDSMSDREIMVTVVEKLHGVSIDDSKSDDYAKARFDAAIEGFRAGSAALDRIREDAQKPDARVRNDLASVRANHVQNQQDSWKKPLPSTLKKGA